MNQIAILITVLYSWWPFTALAYLIFMPAFEILCVFECDLLVVAPHILHDLGQVLTFGGVDVHLHTWLGDLIPQLSHLLHDNTEKTENTHPHAHFRIHSKESIPKR